MSDRIKPLEEKFDLLEETLSFKKTLTQEESDALAKYKTDSSHFYQVINGYLIGNINITKALTEVQVSQEFRRSSNLENFFQNVTNIYNNQIELAKKTIVLIDQVFQKENIPRLKGNEKVYRGMAVDNNTEFLKKIVVGDELMFDNYSSGSLSKSKATEFTYGNYCCLFLLENLKNVPYLVLDFDKYLDKDFERSILKEEFEIFMPRGLKFRITGIEDFKADDYRRLFKKFPKYMRTGDVFSMYERDKGAFKKMIKEADTVRLVKIDLVNKF